MLVMCRLNSNQCRLSHARQAVPVNPFLIIPWRRGARSAKCLFETKGAVAMVEALQTALSSDVIDSLFAIAMGFAVAGLCASSYRLALEHVPSFRLLEAGPIAARFAAVPLLVFAAPYLIMRNTLRGRRLERRRAEFVMIATVIAGLWSLMSGKVVVMALQALLSV
jgi:hypothetical protein